MEAEYVACSATPPIRRLSAGWGVNQPPCGGCYKWSVRHISYHYIEDIAERGEIEVSYIPLVEMVANPMTKGLSLENSESMWLV